MNNILVFPVVFLVVGLAGLVFVSRRRFMRRNFAGVEEFNGFFAMLGARLFERLVRVASVVAVFIGVVGLASAPGQLVHARTAGMAPAAAAAPMVAPSGAHSVVRASAKCYYFNRSSRLVAVLPASSAPQFKATSHSPTGCAAPTSSRV